MTSPLVAIARALGRETGRLEFGAPVTHVYNPLDYAWRIHRAYLERYGAPPREVVLLGMNPGPWGMAQNGIPFGDVVSVREWLGLHGPVGRPPREHPKVPVAGLACHRREVSGRRLWGWAAQRFGTPERFFARFMVLNYCPLCFLEESGRNRTPDRLPAAEREALFAVCDRALRATLEVLRPDLAVGVGRFAEGRVRAVARHLPWPVRVGAVPHPSPASPAANRGWAPQMDAALASLGVDLG